jgi:hypothetical protein
MNNFKYQNYRKILEDVQLVFHNCFTYNEENSSVFNIGEEMYDLFINQLKYHGLMEDAKLVEQKRNDFRDSFSW